MKIYDCFIFYNELDVLEVRLEELNEVVDYFVLVESTHTFTGIPKPLYFKENKDRFKKYSDKIIHIVSENPYIDSQKHWEREEYQRNQISIGIKHAKKNDLIILSDVDEIPKKETVKKHYSTDKIITCELIHCCCYFNLFYGHWINGTRIFKKHKLITPQKNRFILEEVDNNAGWHFGYLGDANHIVKKLASFSHIEYNIPPYNDVNYIQERLSNGKGIFGDGDEGYLLSNEYLPNYINSNLEKFENRLFKGEITFKKPEEVTRRT